MNLKRFCNIEKSPGALSQFTYLYFLPLERELEPRDLGITSIKGPKLHHPFLISFFKNDALQNQQSTIAHLATKHITQEEHVRLRRAASKTKRQKEVSYYDEDDGYNPYVNRQRNRYTSNRSCQRHTLYVSFSDLGWQVMYLSIATLTHATHLIYNE